MADGISLSGALHKMAAILPEKEQVFFEFAAGTAAMGLEIPPKVKDALNAALVRHDTLIAQSDISLSDLALVTTATEFEKVMGPKAYDRVVGDRVRQAAEKLWRSAARFGDFADFATVAFGERPVIEGPAIVGSFEDFEKMHQSANQQQRALLQQKLSQAIQKELGKKNPNPDKLQILSYQLYRNGYDNAAGDALLRPKDIKAYLQDPQWKQYQNGVVAGPQEFALLNESDMRKVIAIFSEMAGLPEAARAAHVEHLQLKWKIYQDVFESKPRPLSISVAASEAQLRELMLRPVEVAQAEASKAKVHNRIDPRSFRNGRSRAPKGRASHR